MKLILATLSILFISMSSYGQYKMVNTEQYGNVKIYKDVRIDALIRKQIAVNEVALHHVPGYRVQVITTSDRAKAMNARATVIEMYPDYKTYLSYQSPYFRVKVGDFRTKGEADQLQNELSKQFSTAVITVRDIINVNPENNDTTNDQPD